MVTGPVQAIGAASAVVDRVTVATNATTPDLSATRQRRS